MSQIRIGMTLALCLLAACSRDEARSSTARAHERPALTHVPGDVPSSRASTLTNRRFPASGFELGPHALVRDARTWEKFWARSGLPAPKVDFRTASILALRVYDHHTIDGAAPSVSARGGMTFVVMPEGVGPARASGADSVVFFRIPVEEGQVRYVAYGRQR